MRARGLFAGLMVAATFTAPAAEAAPAPTIPSAVYYITPDLRDCLFPICGGWFIARVNHPRTRCVDGTMQAQCYVTEIDWPAMGLDPVSEAELITRAYADEVILRARPGTITYPGFTQTFGMLTPLQAWASFP